MKNIRQSFFYKKRYLFFSVFVLFVFLSPNYVFSETKKVVIIRYPIQKMHFKALMEKFKKVMEVRGYIDGQNIEYIDILTSTADKKSIPEVIEAVNKYKDSADLFLTCGWVSLYAREILKKTDKPQVFAPVLESVALKILPSVTSKPETNITGIYLMYPPEKILRITRLIMPNLKKYGYIYDSGIPADLNYKIAFETLNEQKKYGIDIKYIDIASGMENVVKSIKDEKIEAMGYIVGGFIHKEELARANIPVISAFTLDIDEKYIEKNLDENDNIIAGLFNPFIYAGERAGHLAADIFDQKRKINDIIPEKSKQLFFVNLKAAKKFNIFISFRALENIDVVIK